MKYRIKSGMLYQENTSQEPKILASVQGPFYSTRKTILAEDGEYTTGITTVRNAPAHQNQEYVLLNPAQTPAATARPRYAAAENPESHGWPISHAPRIDHADVQIGSEHFCLLMLNSQNYTLVDQEEHAVLSYIHNEIGGGWTVHETARQSLTPALLFGIFFFCRYLEKENELNIV